MPALALGSKHVWSCTSPQTAVKLQARYKVTVPCGNDMRLYSSPLIKFSKACYQLVSGNAWYLSGEQCWLLLDAWGCCSPAAAAAAVLLLLPLPLLHCPTCYLPRPAVRVGYPCFGTPRRVNGKIVGYPAWGRYRVHNL